MSCVVSSAAEGGSGEMECANYLINYLLVNSTKGIFGCWYSPRARCQKGTIKDPSCRLPPCCEM